MSQNPPKILVVDDSATNREFVRGELETGGFAVVEASSGEQGLHDFVESPPDLLLMDVNMPEMSGWDVCAKLKSMAENKHIPIIIMTSRDTEHDMLRSFESGADEFINKPIQPAELLTTVNKLLAARNRAPQGNAS